MLEGQFAKRFATSASINFDAGRSAVAVQGAVVTTTTTTTE